MRRIWIIIVIILLVLSLTPAAAQEGQNLPTELYVLLNSGVIERYGVGAAGVQTVTSEDEFVLDFSVAPDGNWMAYRTEQGLMLTDMYSEQNIVVEEAHSDSVPPIRGQGDTMVWTAVGDALAYTTLYGARVFFNDTTPAFADVQLPAPVHLSWSPDGSHLTAESEGDMWWIFRRDETEMTLVSAIPSSVGTAWVGPAQLVFAPAEGGLILMDMANANVQTVLQDTSWIYSLPYYGEDGTLMVFGRDVADDSLDPGFGRLLTIDSGGAGFPVEQPGSGIVDLISLRWVPRGQLLMAFRGGALVLVHPPSGQGLALPITSSVAYGWGALHPDSVDGLRLPADGYFLAPDSSGVMQVWRLRSNGDSPFTITPAAENVTAYAVSYRGDSVAYVSADKLWYYRPDADVEAMELADAADGFSQLAFSPDGRSVAYVTGDGIRLVGISGTEEAELLLENGADETPPFYRHPRFAQNISALLVAAGGYESVDQSVLDLNTRELLSGGLYSDGIWLNDGRIAMFGNGLGLNEPGMFNDLTIVDVVNQTESETVLHVPYPLILRSVAETGSRQFRMVLMRDVPGASLASVVDAPVGGESVLAGTAGFIVNPQLSPDGTFIAGFRHPGGALILYNLGTGEQVMLSNPFSVHDFRWAGQ